jgi:hypothetical protein
VSYTHRVRYTKNILDGERQGFQIQDSFEVTSAWEASRRALHLSQAGILRDPITRETFTAHNVDIQSIERELPDLVEGGGRGWDAYEAADFAYDLQGDH